MIASVLVGTDASTIGGYTGLAGAVVTAAALARFYWIYTRKIESRLSKCEDAHERDDWRLGFLVNLLRAHGIVIPTRYWSDNWKQEPRELKPDDLTELP